MQVSERLEHLNIIKHNLKFVHVPTFISFSSLYHHMIQHNNNVSYVQTYTYMYVYYIVTNNKF